MAGKNLLEQAQDAIKLIQDGRKALSDVVAAVSDGRNALKADDMAELSAMLATERMQNQDAHQEFRAAVAKARGL